MSQEQYHANQFTKNSLIPQYKVPPKKPKKKELQSFNETLPFVHIHVWSDPFSFVM